VDAIERIIEYFHHPSTYLFRHYSESHQPLRSICLVFRRCFELESSTYTRVIQLSTFEQIIPLCCVTEESPWSDDIETLVIRNRVNWPPLEEDMIKNLAVPCAQISKFTVQDVGSVASSVFALFSSESSFASLSSESPHTRSTVLSTDLTTLQVSSVHFIE